MAQPGDVTQLLLAWTSGDREALDHLMPLVYVEMRRLARRALRHERPGQTIDTTALVHEAYLRLVDQKRTRVESRAHFFGLAAQMMRRVLVDAARRRGAGKRGSGARRLPLEEVPEPSVPVDAELLSLDEALTRLQAFDPQLGRLVELRYFGGLSLEETAEVLGVSRSSATRDWSTARAWLYDALHK